MIVRPGARHGYCPYCRREMVECVECRRAYCYQCRVCMNCPTDESRRYSLGAKKRASEY